LRSAQAEESPWKRSRHCTAILECVANRQRDGYMARSVLIVCCRAISFSGTLYCQLWSTKHAGPLRRFRDSGAAKRKKRARCVEIRHLLETPANLSAARGVVVRYTTQVVGSPCLVCVRGWGRRGGDVEMPTLTICCRVAEMKFACCMHRDQIGEFFEHLLAKVYFVGVVWCE
jgi:hypothetical protein